jgi:hypothetical protein
LRQKSKAVVPLAVLSGTHLVFCLAVMAPDDSSRYALPAVLGVAFLAAMGCEEAARRLRRPAVAWALPALFLAASVRVALPVLAPRTRLLSPPVQAADWVKRNLPPKAILLVSEEMAPHASYLLDRFELAPVEGGLRRAARRPRAPLFLLAEGESGRPGARTFRWPDSTAYRRLTRNHYRVVSVSPIPPAWRFESVRGVHGWEPSLHDARWRWLDDDAAIGIFPKGASAVAVTLGLDASAPLDSNTVAISVNGTPAAQVEIARGAEQRIELPLPAAGEVEIAFRSARSFSPGETRFGGDTRRLAVQLLAAERIER